MGEILGLAPLTQVVFYTLPPPALLQANNAFMCVTVHIYVFQVTANKSYGSPVASVWSAQSNRQIKCSLS